MIARYLDHITFAEPGYFWLLLLLPILTVWYFKFNLSSKASVPVSSLGGRKLHSWRVSLLHLPFVLRLLSLALIITAMAHPQTKNETEVVKGEGIDIVLCIDVSGSMTHRDFKPNRMEAAKTVASDFVKERKTDRISVVVFAEESFTLCPLTADYNMVLSSIASIRPRMIEDGTSIGSGLSTSVDRLRAGNSKSKIVLLLTDGENNGGLIDPNTAKEIAKVFQVKVYTIGVGSDGLVPQPTEMNGSVVTDFQRVNIDEKLLVNIAQETGGKYFRAKDNNELNKIYSEIDQLEKTEFELVKNIQFYDYFYPILLVVVGLLFLELVLRFTVFRKFP